MKNIKKNFITLLFVSFNSVWSNAQHKTEFEFVETVPAALRKTMQNNVGVVFSSIHESYSSGKASLSISRNHATPEAIQQLQALWSTNHFFCTETEIIRRVVRTVKGLQVRNIPVFFKQGGTDEDKYQDIVIDFATDGKISDVYIAIPKHQINQILETQDKVTDLRRRQLILGFVENFLTAYYRKDIAYLEIIFSNDVLDRETLSSDKGISPTPPGMSQEYLIRTKNEYMDNLKKAFVQNQFINIKFSEIEVIQHEGNNNFYGVTLRQDWYSSSYRDSGWFFMMLDFRDENNPLIWVRTWQPITVPRNQVFRLDCFPIK